MDDIKRLGIITLQCFHNYGSMLQALALQVAIESVGENVLAKIIDFKHPRAHFSFGGTHLLYEPTKTVPDRYRAAREIHIEEINERFLLFEQFKNRHMNLTDNFYGVQDLSERCKFDIYVSGSDQIWRITGQPYEMNYIYLLGFTNSPNKLSYASGMNPIPTEPYILDFKYIPLLRAYKKFMVREKVGAATLKKYFDKEVDVVLDPTLLLKVADYQPFISKLSSEINHPFIFAYILGDHDRDGQLTYVLTEFAKQHKKRIKLVYTGIPINNEYVKTMTAAGPSEWLWLLQNADFVITSSFHGTAFSIIYNKPFISIRRDTRKTTLLNTLGLESRLIPTFKDLLHTEIESNIDFAKPNSLLETERTKCKKLLKEAIEMCL